jgi:type I restriction enzyme R subunit
MSDARAMESYRIQETGTGKIALERKPGVLEPGATKGSHATPPEEVEALSRIIAELNQRFGLNLGPEHRVTLGHMMERLDPDAGLDASARVNTRENVPLTFDQVKLPTDSASEYIRTRFPGCARPADSPSEGAV